MFLSKQIVALLATPYHRYYFTLPTFVVWNYNPYVSNLNSHSAKNPLKTHNNHKSAQLISALIAFSLLFTSPPNSSSSPIAPTPYKKNFGEVLVDLPSYFGELPPVVTSIGYGLCDQLKLGYLSFATEKGQTLSAGPPGIKNNYLIELSFIRNSLKYSKTRCSMDAVSATHERLGKFYFIWGDNENSAQSYISNLSLINKTIKKDPSPLNDMFKQNALYHIYSAYQRADNKEKSLFYLKKYLEFAKNAQNNMYTDAMISAALYYYEYLHDASKAEKLLMEALKISEEHGDSDSWNPGDPDFNAEMYVPQYGQLFFILSYFNKVQGNTEMAIIYKKVEYNGLGESEYPGVNQLYRANELSGLGEIYLHGGEYEKAKKLFYQAYEILKFRIKKSKTSESSVDFFLSQILHNMGIAYYGLGDPVKGGKAIREAFSYDKASYLVNLDFAIKYISLNKYKPALEYLNFWANEIESKRETADAIGKRNFLASQIEIYNLTAWAHLALKNPFKAFETIEKTRARVLTERIGGRDIDFNFHLKEFQSQIDGKSAVISFFNTNYTAGETYLNSPYWFVLDKNKLIAEKIIAHDDQKGPGRNIKAPAQVPMQSRGLKLVSGSDGSYSLNQREAKNWLESLINQYRKLLSNPEQDPSHEYKKISRRLYEVLISPLEIHLKNKKDLLIIPDGVLAFLPFETLIDGEGKYLAEKYNISYIQSLSVMSKIKKRNYKKIHRKAFVGFGGALYENAKSNNEFFADNPVKLASIEKNIINKGKDEGEIKRSYGYLGLNSWADLPGTLEEVKSIGKLFENPTIFTAHNVSEEVVKQLSSSGELSNYKVIHFATHGLTVPAIPELSGLVLSQAENINKREDGYLRLEEISKLILKADFVNLSACETGLGKIYGGEGVVGLPQSFLIAGANAVSVSLWKIADQPTKDFMISLYKKVTERGLGYLQAINETKREFIRSKSGSPYNKSHPFYWGPFVYYGLN